MITSGEKWFTHPDGTPRQLSEYTDHQLNFIVWLRYYDWITSGKGPTPPDEEILNNDAELDKYVEAWEREQREKIEGSKKPPGSGKTTGNTGNRQSVQIG